MVHEKIINKAAVWRLLTDTRMPPNLQVNPKFLAIRQVVILSAMLSYSGMFQSHGRSGWTLKEAYPNKNNEAADDPFGRLASSAALYDHRLTSGGTTSEPVEPELGGGT